MIISIKATRSAQNFNFCEFSAVLVGGIDVDVGLGSGGLDLENPDFGEKNMFFKKRKSKKSRCGTK